MDKIWDTKSFEVGGHWPLWRDAKNRMTTQNRQKSNAKKNTQKTTHILHHNKAMNHHYHKSELMLQLLEG